MKTFDEILFKQHTHVDFLFPGVEQLEGDSTVIYSHDGVMKAFKEFNEQALPQSPSTLKEEADEFYPGHRYQRIFDYLYSGGLTLLQSEMQELIKIVHEDFPAASPEPVDTEAVEFAEFIRNLNAENGHDGDWHVPTNNESVDRVLSSKSLYNLFKQSK